MRVLTLTTINRPNQILAELAAGCVKHAIKFVIAGDTKTPSDFQLEGASFLSIQDQEELFPDFAALLPKKHYARKNIAYLSAIQSKCSWIQETDDDNAPLESFFDEIEEQMAVAEVESGESWINIYELFSEERIWPRGFPLELLQPTRGKWVLGNSLKVRGLIRQGLADGNPDVDAVYRMVADLPVDFIQRDAVMPSVGKWCPFNSQNTIFNKEVFTLLYLPSYCSFRMTDIWRSFVAQRCIWELGENVVFHSSTVRQDRNEHNLLFDFKDEVSGYLNNKSICAELERLNLQGKSLNEMQYICYECLVRMELIPEMELALLKAWQKALGELQ